MSSRTSTANNNSKFFSILFLSFYPLFTFSGTLIIH